MTLPGRNFARFILMCFMLFCLVMRTAYQGKQYEFMQKEMRKRGLETIDELIDNNFTFFISNTKTKQYQDFDFYRRWTRSF